METSLREAEKPEQTFGHSLGQEVPLSTGNDLFRVHSVLVAIAGDKLKHSLPIPEAVQEALPAAGPVPESFQRWLGVLDLAVTAEMLRRYLRDHPTDEPTMLALIRFWIAKRAHSAADRDKLDWLLTYLFRMREERTQRPMGWPRSEVHGIFQGLELPIPSGAIYPLLEELSSLTEEAIHCENFSEILDCRLIQRGQEIKNQLGEDFFYPDVLTAVVNYNVVLGKKFRMLFLVTMEKVRELTPPPEGHRTPEAKELLRREYRSTAGDFQRVSELSRRKTQPAAGMQAKSDRKIERSGPVSHGPSPQASSVDREGERAKIQNRVQEIAKQLRSHLGATNIPTRLAPIPLHPWEAQAFRTLSQSSEANWTFDADFRRGVTLATATQSLIYEGVHGYQQASDEPDRQRHRDVLAFLLEEGGNQKKSLQGLVALSQQRGLMEKGAQVKVTIQRLETELTKLAEMLEALPNEALKNSSGSGQGSRTQSVPSRSA